MKVITPGAIDAMFRERLRIVALVLGDQNGWGLAGMRQLRQFGEDVRLAAGFECVGRIESKSVEAERVQPILCVAQHEAPKCRLFQGWSLAPRIRAFRVEVGVGERG